MNIYNNVIYSPLYLPPLREGGILGYNLYIIYYLLFIYLYYFISYIIYILYIYILLYPISNI